MKRYVQKPLALLLLLCFGLSTLPAVQANADTMMPMDHADCCEGETMDHHALHHSESDNACSAEMDCVSAACNSGPCFQTSGYLPSFNHSLTRSITVHAVAKRHLEPTRLYHAVPVRPPKA